MFQDGERRLFIDVQVECFTQKAVNTLRATIYPRRWNHCAQPEPNKTKWTVAIYFQNMAYASGVGVVTLFQGPSNGLRTNDGSEKEGRTFC